MARNTGTAGLPTTRRRRHSITARSIGLALVLAGCVGAPDKLIAPATRNTEDSAAMAVEPSYRLGAGDVVRVTTFGHPDVSGEFEVDENGFIKFPLLGLIEAAGRSVADLEIALGAPLDRDYLVDPQVSAEIVTFRPFYITGQVAQPGRYSFASGMTVRQAVAMAQGYTRRAKTSSIVVIRRSDAGALRIAADEDMAIRPGDTIEVQRRFF